jgi:uncharacterized membrane protein YgcG
MTGNGTSMAAPHVTGAVALLASVSQKYGLSLTASDYKRIILESASKKIPELTLDGKNLGPIAAHGTLDLGAAVAQLLKEYVPGYSFTPVNVEWSSGQTPALTVGEQTTVRATADRSFKTAVVTLKSPNGTETIIEPQISGLLLDMAITPSSEGAYTLNFTLTDAYDVEWDASLTFSVTKKPEDNKPENPDNGNGNGNGNEGGGGGGGGGCSAFGGMGFFILIGFGIVRLVKKSR